MIEEMWRLPDKDYTQLNGSTVTVPHVALRQRNWLGWYKVLPDYGVTLHELPEGSVPLILDGRWVES